MSRSMLFITVLVASLSGWSQDLTQNWTTEKSKHFEDQESGKVSLQLLGVNPFYYVYSTAITSREQALSDYDQIKNNLPSPTAIRTAMAATAPTCADRVATVKNDIATKMTPPTLNTNTNQYSSVTLAATQADWNQNVKADYNGLADPANNCSSTPGYSDVVHAHDVLFPANNIPSVTAVIDAKACRDYTATFSEYFQGVTTGQSAVATFSTTCDQLTLSAGTLLTEVQNPTYASRPSPAGSGQFLSVENTSRFRPTVMGLLNYNFPAFGSGKWIDPFRIGASTGPVFQNAQSGGSSFGWFFGGSVSLYKRLYVSAGEHFGDFPDTPFGFTAGAAIPPNFGQLTPRFRYTGRFAFGITFRTNNIGQIFGGSAAPNTTAKPNP